MKHRAVAPAHAQVRLANAQPCRTGNVASTAASALVRPAERRMATTAMALGRAKLSRSANSFGCWSRALWGIAMSKSENLPATLGAQRRAPPASIKIEGIQGNVVSFASPGPAETAWREQLKCSLGT